MTSMTFSPRSAMLAIIVMMGVQGSYRAQDGRIFLPTAETIALWEFNEFEVDLDTPIPTGSIIPDLSGNGLDATVEANNAGILAVGEGDVNFDNNTACRKIAGGGARVVVNDDGGAFEMEPDDDFSLELYVIRDEQPGTENWGYLAGTAHSRNLIDDSLDPIADGAWYGYGFIRHNEGGGWAWVGSAINADGTFNPSWNEPSSGRFEIPAGVHYLVASVDRELDLTTIYLDGEMVSSLGIRDDGAFVTPPGHDHARFMFLAAEDDASRAAYRPAPTGYAIDAARIQRKAISAEEVLDNWLELQDGVAVPPGAPEVVAVITSSTRDLLVNQCVLLSALNSSAGEGETITQYEWQIGGGAFEGGEVTREVSFPGPTGDAGTPVTLRVTNSNGDTATATVTIVASQPEPVARIDAERGGEVVLGSAVVLRQGEVLTLDGTMSSSPIPDDAYVCPLADEQQVATPAIAEYRWDLDSDGTVDSTAPALETSPWNTPGDFTVTLTVVNDAGGQGSATLEVAVLEVPLVEEAPPGRIFLPTPATIGIWEFNDLDVDIDEPLPTGMIIPDLSGNGLDATVEANDGQMLAARDGDLVFDDNTACGKVLGGAARIVINDDDAFEMGPDDDFSIELYVIRDEQPGGENWGYLAGTAHSRNLVDDNLDPIADGAWYGYGYIRHNEGGGWAWMHSPINADGTFTPSWNEPTTQPRFEIPAGAHYLVASVDRVIDRTTIYLDGEVVGSLGIPDGAALITPPGHDPARVMFLAAEDDASRNAYRPAPTGYGIDAARIQMMAMSAEEVRMNHELIKIGIAVPPTPLDKVPFHRGDPNDDGAINITDPIGILEFLFAGAGEPPGCLEAADVNNDGAVNITDPVGLLGFLFGGDGVVAPPGPVSEPCGPDPDAPGSPGDLGCESYTSC